MRFFITKVCSLVFWHCPWLCIGSESYGWRIDMNAVAWSLTWCTSCLSQQESYSMPSCWQLLSQNTVIASWGYGWMIGCYWHRMSCWHHAQVIFHIMRDYSILSGLSQHIVNFEEFLEGYNTTLVLGGDLTFNTEVRSWCKLTVISTGE